MKRVSIMQREWGPPLAQAWKSAEVDLTIVTNKDKKEHISLPVNQWMYPGDTWVWSLAQDRVKALEFVFTTGNQLQLSFDQAGTNDTIEVSVAGKTWIFDNSYRTWAKTERTGCSLAVDLSKMLDAQKISKEILGFYDPFEMGCKDAFQVNPQGLTISNLKDMTLKIKKSGDDNWFLQKFQMFVNGSEVSFDVNQWIDAQHPFTGKF